jgi:hypothetical protein
MAPYVRSRGSGYRFSLRTSGIGSAVRIEIPQAAVEEAQRSAQHSVAGLAAARVLVTGLCLERCSERIGENGRRCRGTGHEHGRREAA